MTSLSDECWKLEYIDRPSLRERLLAIGQHALRIGRYSELRSALTAIQEGLSRDPIRFGDPRYDAVDAQFSVYCRLIRPPIVTDAVHEEARVVWVSSIEVYDLELHED